MVAATVIRPQMIGMAEAAEILGVSVWTVRKWCYDGKCTSHKIGARLLLKQSEIDRIIAESERPRLASK